MTRNTKTTPKKKTAAKKGWAKKVAEEVAKKYGYKVYMRLVNGDLISYRSPLLRPLPIDKETQCYILAPENETYVLHIPLASVVYTRFEKVSD